MVSKREMVDECGFELYDENVFPLAYLLTFRTFGTWLHGDKRGSVKRNGSNIYGTPRIERNETLEARMRDEMTNLPFMLSGSMRIVADDAIRDICRRRGFVLRAANVRANHVHLVVSAAAKPERIIDSLKASVTKMLREQGLVGKDTRVWSRGRSRRYLWKPRHVHAAIEYTLFGQEDQVFGLED